MLSLFHRKKAPPVARPSPAPPIELPKGLIRPEPAASLLATPRRQKLLEHIWQRTSVSRSQFAALYRAPLERYAELVQQFPASESHHHNWPGGMLDHGLEIVAYALKLRQSHLLPAGATPEAQAAQAEAWSAGVAYAALLHDVGKVAVDLHVEYGDGTVWHPWHGPVRRPYRFRYRPDRAYRLHGAATGLLYARLLDPAIFDWLCGYPDLWAALLYVFAGQYEHAGILGELVTQADQASVAQALGGDPARALNAPRQALQRKLLDGLRYLLKEEFRLNQSGPSDGWLTQDALWLVSKTVSDKLRAHLLAQGIDGIPASNTAVFNVLQDHGIAQATPDGKAIWTATVTSDAGWSHSFTFLKLSPALIWEAGERPASFGGTVQVDQAPAPATAAAPTEGRAVAIAAAVAADSEANVAPTADAAATQKKAPVADSVDALLGLLEPDAPDAGGESASISAPVQPLVDEPSVATAAKESTSGTTPSPMPGDHFMAWLKNGIVSRKLLINDARALVHTVDGTAYLVSPGLFQRYAQEHPEVAKLAGQENLSDWQWVQKQFERLRLHRKQSNGLNIWRCNVTGSRKSRRLHGYLLENVSVIFEAVPPDNPYLSISTTADSDN
ncbi:MobH family relaxase [Burkholderia cepacia]|uniref:MobH family relaxase n=1 Tax=Burkholderia cepacia TaxID=292 RepID=UPI002AB705F6|nr:MobH family relaxase [Burkholderia cepacia]